MTIIVTNVPVMFASCPWLIILLALPMLHAQQFLRNTLGCVAFPPLMCPWPQTLDAAYYSTPELKILNSEDQILTPPPTTPEFLT